MDLVCCPCVLSCCCPVLCVLSCICGVLSSCCAVFPLSWYFSPSSLIMSCHAVLSCLGSLFFCSVLYLLCPYYLLCCFHFCLGSFPCSLSFCHMLFCPVLPLSPHYFVFFIISSCLLFLFLSSWFFPLYSIILSYAVLSSPGFSFLSFLV